MYYIKHFFVYLRYATLVLAILYIHYD